MDNMNIISLDCESAGLSGPIFAFGYTIQEGGFEVASGWYSFGISKLLRDMSREDQRWILENTPIDVLVPDGDKRVAGPEGLKTAFESVLKRYPEHKLLVDCGYPVETRFLHACETSAYPLIDLTGILIANGKDPLGTFERLPCELPKHHPENDARQSARIFAIEMGLGLTVST
jgi:hypothetical protein